MPSANALFPLTTRQACLDKMVDQMSYDIIIIGGGASGIGIALEAITRGYQVLLLERDDFSKGTSSRSTKLIHGGVRYLANADFGLVRGAAVERARLLRNAPHLVRNLSFIVPLYSWKNAVKYYTGLKFYDWISSGFSPGPSQWLSTRQLIKALPGIKRAKLFGGISYHDGQFDDSRLAINLVQTLWQKGGHAINYAAVTGLLKNKDGKICGVQFLDRESGKSIETKAKTVVNATGVFAGNILQMDEPQAARIITVSQGIHLVLDKKFLSGEHALMIPKTSDGRVLFAVPWHGKLVVGTTDTEVDEAVDEPVALENEIQFILDTAANYLAHPPGRKDVLSVFAGLRPLAVPQQKDIKTKTISRNHKIIVSKSGLFTMLGGKWTTYRKMGEDLVDKMEKELQWPATRSITKNLRIYGYQNGNNWQDPLFFYGNESGEIRKAVNEAPQNMLSSELNLHAVQVEWAVEKEMARTVEDVLARRTRALFLNASEAIRIAPAVADIMARCLHKEPGWTARQIDSFNSVAANYLIRKG